MRSSRTRSRLPLLLLGLGLAALAPARGEVLPEDWRVKVASRKKFQQILDAFQGEDMSADTYKYICAPCSNCKGAMRDLLNYYELTEKHGIHYGGLVELMVNAMVDAKPGFLTAWEA